MGLSVRYQSVPLEEQWSRVGSLFVASGHVNITLSGDPSEPWRIESRQRLTIDFFPPNEWRGRKPRPINEARIAAMYMNNRAAESLMQNNISEAYAWAKGAALRDPEFFIAHNTLGVVYRRNASYTQAQRAFEHVLTLAPDNLQALSNLALVLRDQGRLGEAEAVNQRLVQLQPHPPYHYFEQGQKAFANGDLETAREHFAREVQRASYNAEFHYWLAVTHHKLGNRAHASEHLARAVENSTTQRERQLYGAKLESIRTPPPH
jgi:Flp pilus assembly protein TadD